MIVFYYCVVCYACIMLVLRCFVENRIKIDVEQTDDDVSRYIIGIHLSVCCAFNMPHFNILCKSCEACEDIS